ncbi:MAG: triose-phosphate isomerase [Aminobacteriaceae bacterium]|uniref:triose-phosphate isomerase n=1 Tax=Aminivibrio sp. TaxID=1872489 RepID=UPI002A1CA11F|nr:triose-phosphate isomerase [Synergistaceae bacterium]MDD3391155.1 triose-phosphate isomerase [Synergistaceae bacterium]MDD4020584.1 triose-phosphate isomerase [Synergistaceae bacterium]MDD4611420.1 triose-phosphate isomerase [Synergistaceae bacterium]
MKKIYLYGNWKMNMLPFEGEEFCRTLGNKMQGDIYSSEMIQVCLFPPFLTIPEVLKSLPEDVPVACGAQDGYFEDRGAFTGEVSMDMVKAVGCSHVLAGHSERRHIFGESNEIVAKKLAKALEAGLKAVLCFGETLDERESGKTLAVAREQLESAFSGLEKDKGCGIILAYEPVWAIGTGKNARPEDAQEVCGFAAKMAEEHFGTHPKIPVLYGGSVKESNALDLLSQHDIDGALVGGASLKVDSFLGIYENYRTISV